MDQLCCEDLGSELPVLLIHGFMGTARKHLGPLIDTLSLERRVIAPDLRGYGASAHLPRHFDEKFYHSDAQDLLRLIDHIGIDTLDIIGYSDGGETAIILASLLGSRARSMTIWGVSGRIPPAALIAKFADPEQGFSHWPILKNELEHLHGTGSALPMLREWAHAMLLLGEQGGAINDAEARSVVCPTLIVAGTRDPFNPITSRHALAERIPHARLVVLPDAGHDLLTERGPQLTALIRSMLENPSLE